MLVPGCWFLVTGNQQPETGLIVLYTLPSNPHFYNVETITLKQVLDWLDSGAPCDMAVVTCDEKRNKGGEWLMFNNVRKTEYVSAGEQAKIDKAQPQAEFVKDPNHYQNSTRNIIFENNEIRKIAIRLIRRFNGKIVT